jgi:anaerobic ribonucleoside-triphosphate reductase
MSAAQVLPSHVIKRDGGVKPFVVDKIADAHIEQIQDAVEAALFDAGHRQDAARLHRLPRAAPPAARPTKTAGDVESAMVNEYLQQRDWRVNANANQGYSLGGLILNVSGKVTANYWLDHVYPPEVGRAHREADLHIHDLDMLSGLLRRLVAAHAAARGLERRAGQGGGGPPKHLSSAVGQIVNFLGTLQNEWAGAQAFSSFDTYLAPYVRVDALGYDAGAPVHAGAGLQPQRALALGHADAVHQPHLRLDLPGRPARAGAGDRRP